MKVLVMCPGTIAPTKEKINCFSQVLNYYIPRALSNIVDCDTIAFPNEKDLEGCKKAFENLNLDSYDAIITTGLRFYSKIPNQYFQILRNKFKGPICQTYDGSRGLADPVDITFTSKNNISPQHSHKNVSMGWAADHELNYPNQSLTDLRILIDHTNYGGNKIDSTVDIIKQVKKFVDSNLWKKKWNSVSVRRFCNGKIVDVDFNDLNIETYNKTVIPITEISKEHCEAHVFIVTHPESLGLVALETALAGAYVVCQKNYISQDRLNTIRSYTHEGNINWRYVLDSINPKESRKKALENTWENLAKRIVNELKKRIK
jgi:uncharacterized ubiquitin-like protein YukD